MKLKQLLRRILVLVVLCSLMSGVGLVNAQPAHALPTQYIAAATCDLPDGSSDGQLLKDGHTCCPPGSVGANDSETAIRCVYGKYLNPAIDLLAAIVGIAVIIAIIYGAIEYITSAGDPQRVAAGKKRIIEALIGLVSFILLYSFLQFLIPGGLFNQ